jgi:hypothetical protein
MHLIRVASIADGFHNLSELKKHPVFQDYSSSKLHYFLHQFTGSATLNEFVDIHCDPLQVRAWTNHYMAPQRTKNDAEELVDWQDLYLRPQYPMVAQQGDLDATISALATESAKMFFLPSETIELAKAFLCNYRDPPKVPRMQASICGGLFFEPLTVRDFTSYTYPNGHKGCFPLDVNK